MNWSRYRTGVAQRVGRGIALLFHDRGTRRGWVVNSTPRPHFTPGKDPLPILQEAGWSPGPVWTCGKSRPHRDSIPDLPARSQWLYRLSYPTHRNNVKRPAKNVSTTWMSTYGTLTTHQVPVAVKHIYSHDYTLNPADFPVLDIWSCEYIRWRLRTSQTTKWEEVSSTTPDMLISIQLNLIIRILTRLGRILSTWCNNP